MEIVVHQALFGDKNGAYDLLKTTHEAPEEIQRIRSTDLYERPTEGLEWSPAYRGMPHKDFYLIFKTYKDTSPEVRAGRVFSHVLILPLDQIGKIHDLNYLCSYFPESLNKEIRAEPIIYNTTEHPQINHHLDQRVNTVIKGMLAWSKYKNTIVWFGNSGFEQMINTLWGNLRQEFRKDFFFGIGFEPREVNTGSHQIICVPVVLENKWVQTGFWLVKQNDFATLSLPSELFLIGKGISEDSMQSMIADLEINLQKPENLTFLEKVLNTYNHLDEQLSFAPVFLLTDLIKTFSPNVLAGEKAKKKIISKLADVIAAISVKEVIALGSIDLAPFKNGEVEIAEALLEWGKINLASFKPLDLETLFNEAFIGGSKPLWWKENIKKAVQHLLENWKKIYANWFWQVCLSSPSLFPFLSALLPNADRVEVDLVKNFPKNISNILADEVATFSSARKWLILHACALRTLHETKEAFRLQISIDTDVQHDAGFKIISSNALPFEIIDSALVFTDDRLYKLAGVACARDTNLMKDFILSNPSWRTIWFYACENGIVEWPEKTSFESLWNQFIDLFIQQQQTQNDENLLSHLIQSESPNLLKHPNRSEVWSKLPLPFRKTLLQNTVTVWNDQWKGASSYRDIPIEVELKQELFKDNNIRSLISNLAYLNTFLIGMFQSHSYIPQYIFKEFIEKRSRSFNSVECKNIGLLVLKRNWRDVYFFIKNSLRYQNDNFSDLIEICQDEFEPPALNPFYYFARFLGIHNRPYYQSQNPSPLPITNQLMQSNIILILTALPLEYQAIRLFLEPNSIQPETHDSGTIYETGVFNEGSLNFQIAIVRTTVNNYQSSIECEKAISFFKPRMAFFTGVAGGIKDVNIGDVVVANKICGYESGKSSEDKFSSRIEPAQSDYGMQKFTEYLENINSTEWRNRIKFSKPDKFKQEPVLRVAPIASGEQVVGSTESDIYKLIRERCNDSIAVEMEAVGFYNSCRSNRVPGLMVRGISDLIDDKTEVDKSNSQLYAASTAAAVTFEIISKLSN